jgi:hypothetical protein
LITKLQDGTAVLEASNQPVMIFRGSHGLG